MARLFVGIPLPQKLRARLSEEVDRLRLSPARVRWVQPDDYHVTVKFLGEVTDQELPDVARRLDHESAGCGVLDLEARGLGHFPEGRPPRVLWCGVIGRSADEQEALQDLRRRLEKGLGELGFRREKGRFQPHVTLGRLRERDPGPALEDLLERMGPGVRRPFGCFRAPEVVLYESRLLPEGPAYTPLHHASLA